MRLAILLSAFLTACTSPSLERDQIRQVTRLSAVTEAPLAYEGAEFFGEVYVVVGQGYVVFSDREGGGGNAGVDAVTILAGSFEGGRPNVEIKTGDRALVRATIAPDRECFLPDRECVPWLRPVFLENVRIVRITRG